MGEEGWVTGHACVQNDLQKTTSQGPSRACEALTITIVEENIKNDFSLRDIVTEVARIGLARVELVRVGPCLVPGPGATEFKQII